MEDSSDIHNSVCSTPKGETVHRRQNVKFVLFGGKGGVGKTTMSAAYSLFNADNGEKVLLVSTDPAHSTSDALDMDCSGHEPISVTDNMDCMELDISHIKESYAEALTHMMASMGLDMANSPYIDEALLFGAVVEIVSPDEESEYRNLPVYDRIVFDTAPSGHTLFLLKAVKFLESKFMRRARALGKVRAIPGFVKEKILHPMTPVERKRIDPVGYYTDRFCDVFTSGLEILQNHGQTTFHPVMLADILSLNETRKLIRSLDELGIKVGEIFLNKVIQIAVHDCERCKGDMEYQDEIVYKMRDDPIFYPWGEVLYKRRPVGIEALRDLGRDVFTVAKD